MREVVYTDEDGRKFLNMIPDDAPDSHAEFGVRVGPPDLDALKLPLEIEVRLNNSLFNRKLLRRRDVRRSRQEVIAALMSTLKIDADIIIQQYDGGS